MKVVAFEEFGAAGNLKLVDRPMPACGPDEVVIKTAAVSVNPVDVKTRQGEALASQLEHALPLVLGWDIAGEVVAVGRNVQNLSEGDDVFGMILFPKPPNGYAQYVAAPADELALIPAGVSYEAAAASTLAALTAWQAFTHFGQIKAGDRVLIHAASGGVGHFAVQMAKHLGAYVIATSSAKNKAFVESLGADEHIDYKAVRFEDEIGDIDFCLETQGGAQFQRSVSVMRDGGTIINLPSGLVDSDREAAERKGLFVNYFMHVFPSGENMREIAAMLGDGTLVPHISERYTLEETAEAHEHIESGRTVGKVVITL
ncbi:alcohol dehydrogenase zinc-binding domain-containing protein [Salinisphaera shabanensis T35B1]|uniref:NADP-dependent oxidoreductase n=1 Tax=Salinisphaera shabanensis TaxID=180542 RepID=UPI0033407800